MEQTLYELGQVGANVLALVGLIVLEYGVLEGICMIVDRIRS